MNSFLFQAVEPLKREIICRFFLFLKGRLTGCSSSYYPVEGFIAPGFCLSDPESERARESEFHLSWVQSHGYRWQFWNLRLRTGSWEHQNPNGPTVTFPKRVAKISRSSREGRSWLCPLGLTRLLSLHSHVQNFLHSSSHP